jgi:hypothetical protein
VNGELRPVVEYLRKAFDLDEVVAVERVHHFGHVVPHLGVKFAGAVAEGQREIKLAGLLLVDLLGVNQEAGSDYPVHLEFVYVRRFHLATGGA